MITFKRLLLIVVDFGLLIAALAISLWLRYELSDTDYSLSQHLVSFAPVFLLWIVVFYINQLYDFYNYFDRTFLAFAAARSGAINFIITIIFFYVIPRLILTPKTILVLMVMFSCLFIFVWRLVFNLIFSRASLRKKVIIVGSGKIEYALAKIIRRNPAYGYQLVGLVSEHSHHRLKKIRQLGRLEELETVLAGQPVDTIGLDVNRFSPNNLVFGVISDRCLSDNLEVIDVYTFYERLTGQVPLENLSQVWFTNINQSSLRGHVFLKRLVDIVISLIGLAVFIAMFPLLYVLVKLDSPGPFFYRQARLGAKKQVFDVVKIRTMYINSEASGGRGQTKATWARPGDKRVTPVGAILRKSCLDELPQLYNVLVGQMSIVGPRPERPEFIAKLNRRQKLYYKRHLIKPGLTGWAQVMMGYGASFADADAKLQYDLYYLKNRSIFLDFLIILRTIRIIFTSRGGV